MTIVVMPMTLVRMDRMTMPLMMRIVRMTVVVVAVAAVQVKVRMAARRGDEVILMSSA